MHDFGAYSSRARARRKRQGLKLEPSVAFLNFPDGVRRTPSTTTSLENGKRRNVAANMKAAIDQFNAIFEARFETE
jgi:hypothetical protein